MSPTQPPQNAQKISLFRGSRQSERYSLALVKFPKGYGVRAKPYTSDYVFDRRSDAEFYLYECAEFNNAIERYLNDYKIELATESSSLERFIVARRESSAVYFFNLDQFLDLVERRDAYSGILKATLERKSTASKRSIILCFDGTSNHFSNQNTNVVKLVELLRKDDPEEQLVYYQPGVGTYTSPGIFTGIGQTVASAMDKAVAWYLYQHIIDGYQYLMQTYRAGDRISIFGFSRGAYTARALAGMLHSVGLLPRHNLEQAPFAYEVYANSKEFVETDFNLERTQDEQIKVSFGFSSVFGFSNATDPKHVDPRTFKRAFCIPIVITLLGVWDTVGSVGTFRRKTLPWIEYNPSVRHFRQALALDENRGNFIPSLWDHSRTDVSQTAYDVWFKGGHTDIGGGAPPSGTVWNITALQKGDLSDTNSAVDKPFEQPPRLSNITLRWMVEICLSIGEARISFDPTTLRIYRDSGILVDHAHPDAPHPLLRKASKDRAHLDSLDIREKPYIVLNQSPLWWFLECLAIPKLSQQAYNNSRPETVYRPNLGEARYVSYPNKPGVFLHYSVYSYLLDEADYTPAAKWHSWPAREFPAIFNDPKVLVGKWRKKGYWGVEEVKVEKENERGEAEKENEEEEKAEKEKKERETEEEKKKREEREREKAKAEKAQKKLKIRRVGDDRLKPTDYFRSLVGYTLVVGPVLGTLTIVSLVFPLRRAIAWPKL